MNIKQKLGKRIQELRHKNNLKQSELAELVGIATKTQSCIETGKNYPSAELMERYAKAFKLDISEVFELGHVKSTQDLLDEVYYMIKKATPSEITLIHKILKSFLR